MSTVLPEPPTLQELKLTPISPAGELVRQAPVEAIPPEAAQAFWKRHLLVLVFMVVPMFFGAIYYLLIASDRYVSEAKFIIRSASAKTSAGPLANMIQTQGLVRADEETYIVNEFIRSRDAVSLLSAKDNLMGALGAADADFINRYPNIFTSETQESLYRHFLDFISITYQSSTGISTLKVSAFAPADSQRLADALLRHAETVINRINQRARADTEAFAARVVKDAELRVIQVQQQILEFRNRERMIDPEKQSTATIEMLGKLDEERVRLEAALSETIAVAPESPKIPPIRNRLNALNDEIKTIRQNMTGQTKSLATNIAEFERLNLQRELGAKQLGIALTSLDNARQEAMRQQLYLERIVAPNLSDKAREPKRLLGLLVVFIVSFCVFWFVKFLISVTLEHEE